MVSKDISKGLTLIAFGFLFVLLNITINDLSITPSFIGWLLFYIAIPYLGEYTEGKDYLKWAALILTIVTAVQWVLEITHAAANIESIKTIVGLVNAVFMFILLGVLENIARDNKCEALEGRLGALKIVNIVSYLGTLAFGMLYSVSRTDLFALLAFACGVVAIIAAIVTCFTLFKLKKEIAEGTAVA
ncbi:MAG: hypothetical protein IKF18_05015 [Erysipelotrichaceae bacterium]|nr:hypothetical protein [Erysipelotrichaceae bacterium]MBR3168024.1 hypothetical protein [Erysipelotrichaceae bacterium]